MEEKFTFFWRHRLSQWHMVDFIDISTNTKFNCAEQYMMYHKALLFNDQESAAKILAAAHPRDQQALGRNVAGFDKNVWDLYARDIVYNGNYYRFMQNRDQYDLLLSTQGTTLVEASPEDTIWGIGLGKDDPRCLDRKLWRGTNWLGETLTKLRDDFIAGQANPIEINRISGI